MIDVQKDIYQAVKSALTAVYPGITVTCGYHSGKPKHPSVELEEVSNTPVFDDTRISSQYARLNYQFRVYSEKRNGKIAEAREILSTIDSVCEGLNMRRISYSTMDGLYENTTYLLVASYGVTVGADGTMYRQ